MQTGAAALRSGPALAPDRANSIKPAAPANNETPIKTTEVFFMVRHLLQVPRQRKNGLNPGLCCWRKRRDRGKYVRLNGENGAITEGQGCARLEVLTRRLVTSLCPPAARFLPARPNTEACSRVRPSGLAGCPTSFTRACCYEDGRRPCRSSPGGEGRLRPRSANARPSRSKAKQPPQAEVPATEQPLCRAGQTTYLVVYRISR